MGNPFHSTTTFVSPSLNRVRFAQLPGNHFPAQYRGKSAYALLSSDALCALIEARAAELELDPHCARLLWDFDHCFQSSSSTVRASALQIAADFGRRLALLVAALKGAAPANRRARPSWSDEHWKLWQRIETITFGGGLLAGALGPLAISSAEETLRGVSCGDIRLRLSPFGASLPLAGLARSAPAGTQAMLLLDFGQTNIKRGIVSYAPNSAPILHFLPSIELKLENGSQQGSPRSAAEETAELITNVVADSWQEAAELKWTITPTIGLSLACYLQNGQPPVQEMGFYGRLQLLSDHLQTYLCQRLGDAVKRKVQINLFHDGTAAALTAVGRQNTAVLVLGTAIGVGFPPETKRGLQQLPILVAD